MAKLSLDQYEKKLKRWIALGGKDVANSLKKGAMVVVREAQEKHLTGPRMPRGVGSLTKGTLAVISETLRRSIAFRVTAKPGEVRAEVGTNVRYGRAHELGLGRMPARPFLRPSVDTKKPEVMRLLLEGFMKQAKR